MLNNMVNLCLLRADHFSCCLLYPSNFKLRAVWKTKTDADPTNSIFEAVMCCGCRGGGGEDVAYIRSFTVKFCKTIFS